MIIIERKTYIEQLSIRKHNGMIKIVTGIRRSGKSYLLFKLFVKHLIETGVNKENIIAIDLEDLYNMELRNSLNLLRFVDSKIKGEGMYYLLIDEVQLLENFEEVLNTFLKRDNIDVYVTGSNARFLSKDVITTFRGRGDDIHVYPLNFEEYSSVFPELSRDQCLYDYMQYGGLPQTVTMKTEQQKKQYLLMLFKNTYLVDIKERYNIKNDSDLEELIDVVASGIGSLTNPVKLQNTFKSVKQSSVSANTIKTYLDYLQDAFLINKAIRYDIKGRKYIETPSKYYFEDLGLRNARLNFRQTEQTHLMENLIYNELRMRGYSVDVGQVTLNTKDDNNKSVRKLLEVDFVCNKGYERLYIQSAYALPSEEKRMQESKSLKHVNDEFPKIIIAGGMQPTYRDNDGILTLNIFDFLQHKVII